MEDLIKSLQIFLRHGNVKFPTHCEHDIMYIFPNNPEGFTEEEVAELDKLGWHWDEDDESWQSFKFGSC